MKRVLALLLSLTLACGILAGCESQDKGGGSNTGSTDGVTEVYYFSGIGAYKDLLSQKVNEWNETTGKEKNIRIKIEFNIDDYDNTATAMMQSGTFPDIVDYAYQHPEWTEAGWIKDLNTIDNAELKELIKYYEPFMVKGTNYHNGTLISLPLELVPIKMVYNKDLFAKNNLSEPPKTWDELVEYAKIITENGEGKEYGFGFTYNWSGGFRRLAMKGTISSVGHGWFDNAKGEYNFSDFKPVIEAIATMYKDGSLFPDPAEIAIDPLRSQFAEGLIGMEIAPAYDISVYNTQFPAKCDWGVADVPYYTADGKHYKGVALNRANNSITSAVSDDRLEAVVEVFNFLNSKELYTELYQNCAIIPHDTDITENTTITNPLKNWDKMSDMTNYAYMPEFPDNLITLEGDTYQQTFEAVVTGTANWDDVIDDLNDRYNKAYQEAKEAGYIDVESYERPVDFELDS